MISIERYRHNIAHAVLDLLIVSLTARDGCCMCVAAALHAMLLVGGVSEHVLGSGVCALFDLFVLEGARSSLSVTDPAV